MSPPHATPTGPKAPLARNLQARSRVLGGRVAKAVKKARKVTKVFLTGQYKFIKNPIDILEFILVVDDGEGDMDYY